jgi:hypothetical protein
MNLRKHTLGMLGAALALFAAAGVASAADRPYTEGAVLNVSSIRTEPGMFDSYMSYLATTYKQTMDAQKAAGIILDYSVYTVVPRGPDDPDIYLVTVYKNMAALDGLTEKLDPIQQKAFGDLSQRSAATIERGKMRTALGTEMIREIKLK